MGVPWPIERKTDWISLPQQCSDVMTVFNFVCSSQHCFVLYCIVLCADVLLLPFLDIISSALTNIAKSENTSRFFLRKFDQTKNNYNTYLLTTLIKTLIILPWISRKTEFNNCFIIHC